MNLYCKILIYSLSFLLIGCYQKVKHSKDLGTIESIVNFRTDKPIHRIMLDSNAEGADITLTVITKKWTKNYKFQKTDLGTKDSYGMMFHIIDVPKNLSDKMWEYSIDLKGNTEKVKISYWYLDYPKK